MAAPIELPHLSYMKVFNNASPHAPFTWVQVFTKKAQDASRNAFKETHDELTRFLDEQGVNYGMVMFLEGFMVFTEHKVNFDKLVVKLTTGMDMTAQEEFNLTNWLKRMGVRADGPHAHLFRE